jgi:hypothetical protein
LGRFTFTDSKPAVKDVIVFLGPDPKGLEIKVLAAK